MMSCFYEVLTEEILQVLLLYEKTGNLSAKLIHLIKSLFNVPVNLSILDNILLYVDQSELFKDRRHSSLLIFSEFT